MPETKECRICHRIGRWAFVPEGDYGWVCARDDLCRARAIMRMDSMGVSAYCPVCGDPPSKHDGEFCPQPTDPSSDPVHPES